MKVSVVIPCLNAAESIGVQLESLANQQWSQAWEVIISDNGSTDNTASIVEQYQTRIPNLHIVDSYLAPHRTIPYKVKKCTIKIHYLSRLLSQNQGF